MKRVVVIGGGFAGAFVAKDLQDHFEVILIDTKDYFEFTPSVLRTLVEPEHVKKINVSHKNYLKKAKIVVGEVKEVSTENLTIKQGKTQKKIHFDYLVIASGSKYSSPIKQEHLVLASRAEVFKKYTHKFERAKNMLIIGGGPAGVELAAEIACNECSNGRKVFLAHSGTHLLERSNPKTIEYVENFLTKQGVELILDERVVKEEDGFFVTEKGNKIKADLAFLCTGIKPNFEFMEKHHRDKLNEKNHLKVNRFLQLEGHKNIFVAGDISAVEEEKTAQNAEKQAEIVAENIRRLENNQKLEEYKHKPRPMVLSLGKDDGIFMYKNFAFGGKIPALLKSFIEWKTMRRYS